MPDATFTQAQLAAFNDQDPEDWPEPLVGILSCGKCDALVALVQNDPENWPGLATGTCCDVLYADWWEGTFAYELPVDRPVTDVVDQQGRV